MRQTRVGAVGSIVVVALGVLGLGCPHATPDPDATGAATTSAMGSGGSTTATGTGGSSTTATGTGGMCDGGPPSPTWAEWKMPNPPDSGLPNVAMYDTTTIVGVVIDKVTGLQWQRVIDPGSYMPSDAVTYCANLALAGGCWRLPTRIELVSLVDFTKSSSGSTIDSVAFPDTPGTAFGTSSPLAGSPSGAWGVNFFGGNTGYSDVSNAFRVRCVR